MENAVMEIEKRKIQREEGIKAQKALESLEVSKPSGAEVKSSDVDYLVSVPCPPVLQLEVVHIHQCS
jgi:hypothetical protein